MSDKLVTEEFIKKQRKNMKAELLADARLLREMVKEVRAGRLAPLEVMPFAEEVAVQVIAESEDNRIAGMLFFGVEEDKALACSKEDQTSCPKCSSKDVSTEGKERVRYGESLFEVHGHFCNDCGCVFEERYLRDAVRIINKKE
jgi:hypothetical protein